MAILKSIEKQTNNKFLNLYTLGFHNQETGKDFNYFVASRRDEENLTAVTNNHTKADAVMMFSMFSNGDIALIRQFRPVINDYIYGSPAGLVDDGETVEEAVKRELFEETGLDVVSVELLVKPSYTSVGLTDESLAVYKCIVDGEISTINKEENEDIEVIILKKDDIGRFLTENTVSLQTALILSMLNR